MAKPATRQGLIDYCLRKLGAPVLEINVDDDQIDDLVDDAIQFFNERHFDGVERMYLKYKLTQADIDRGQAKNTDGVGIVTTTATSTNIAGYGTTTANWYETSNFIQVPDSVVGIEKIFKFDSSSISGGMFSIKYQLFLNDLYHFNSVELLQYAMTKSYLEDIDFLLTTDKQVRFNKRQDRLYLDIDWGYESADDWLILDCYRALDPATFTNMYNDLFLKQWVTALIKRQWGQNMSKFKGVKLPGGIEMNGSEIYSEAVRELDGLRGRMASEFEIPEDVKKHMLECIESGMIEEEKWIELCDGYKNSNPKEYDELNKILNKKLIPGWDKEILEKASEINDPEATRASSGASINLLTDYIPNLIGGSADLTGSTNTEIKNSGNFSKNIPTGRNIKFGVREHGMGGVMNGISAHGNFRVFGGTFLVFADYMRASIRLSALSKLNTIFIFTHDSIGLGEDGPTHQPISQLMSLRTIPNLNVFRPADKKETLMSWVKAIKTNDKPTAIVLSRQALPDLETLTNNKLDFDQFSKGAYICYQNTNEKPEVIFLSTGSEVSETIKAAKKFGNTHKIRVVSIPCWDLFEEQSNEIQNQIIPSDTKNIISVEAGVGLGWQKFTKSSKNIISIESYGASGPGKELIESFGFSSDRIFEKAKLIIS